MTSKIPQKTLEDLEFYNILEQVAKGCLSDLSAARVKEILPLGTKDLMMQELKKTNEYLASYDNNNALPNHGFDPLDKEFTFLNIENSYLETSSFTKIKNLIETTAQLVKFLEKFNEYYPSLCVMTKPIELHEHLVKSINNIINNFSEVKNDASPDLEHIRYQIGLVRGKINQSFGQSLSHYNQLGYLDEIRESFIDNKRVLAVLAMYKRKVKGNVLGSSKTGSIVFIEPETTYQFARELQSLTDQEQKEIIRILKLLTNQIRPFLEPLKIYQTFLINLDVIAAKAKYARKIKGILPEINQENLVYYREAYHPILYLTNLVEKKITHPQTIELTENKRIIVISGPNAGGKTIALKTIGLLQLMLQSGLLIPVHERSSTCFFNNILTDIGDNQSIENHLSTYSYRLKNMNYFLKKCQNNTLFLIDEFGTGSDPELGGALAETFLEEFYHREAYGIITTHYTNLKLLANELPNAINANMLFDQKTLEPLYKLQMGEPGSSFTFEVAQKNGIPFGLINRAKKKIERTKVRFDKTIATLQKERAKAQKNSETLWQEEQKAKEESIKLREVQDKIKTKLIKYQELYDANQRLIFMGQKLEEAAINYFDSKNKKTLVAELIKLVEIENSKRKKQTKDKLAQETKNNQKVLEEIKPELNKIRAQKKSDKQKEIEQKLAEPKHVFKIGDPVRMFDGKAVGTIETIQKNKATVNYGLFMSQVSLDLLAYVPPKAAKK